MTLELLCKVARVLETPLATLVAEEVTSVDEREESVNRIVNMLRQRPANDVRDMVVIIERVLAIKGRAKRRKPTSEADG